jgi:hypothetical protein
LQFEGTRYIQQTQQNVFNVCMIAKRQMFIVNTWIVHICHAARHRRKTFLLVTTRHNAQQSPRRPVHSFASSLLLQPISKNVELTCCIIAAYNCSLCAVVFGNSDFDSEQLDSDGNQLWLFDFPSVVKQQLGHRVMHVPYHFGNLFLCERLSSLSFTNELYLLNVHV